MSYAEQLAADRRLTILKLLADSAGYSANEYLLQSALEGFGHAVGQDLLRTELAWLAEQSLVAVLDVAQVNIAKLTARGGDVAAGRISVPGVKRPGPAA
ncbi:MAG: ArsR family transcriptional regulator [Gammaproteobacteria bacterium]|nr:ArsR family transcriptional regulator [Gammaproteobacteria bacterium]